MSPFWQEVIGKGNDLSILEAAFVFAILGHVLILLGGTMLRNPTSTASPQKFSVPYLIYDNGKRISYVLLLIIAAIRFSPDLFGIQVSPWGGFLVGSGLDGVALLIKQKTKLLDPATK
jgi:hypothetical protein